jgi:hypothetical protein
MDLNVFESHTTTTEKNNNGISLRGERGDQMSFQETEILERESTTRDLQI